MVEGAGPVQADRASTCSRKSQAPLTCNPKPTGLGGPARSNWSLPGQADLQQPGRADQADTNVAFKALTKQPSGQADQAGPRGW